MPDWVQEILNPLPINVVGIDPQYEEDFCNLKQEVEKLSAVDFKKIKTLAIRLLSDKTKDLRVAGYLFLACSYLDDVKMMIHVLFAYENLINLYWNDLHPQRLTAKISAIDWLNNERLAGFIINKFDSSDKSDIKMLLNHINSLNMSLIDQGGDTVVQFSRISKILKEQTIDIIVPSNEQHADMYVQSEEPSMISLQSREEVEIVTRNIIAYFNKNGQKLYAAAFARALKWSALNPAITLDNKTVFSTPCHADKKELKLALKKGDPKELYEICEKQFLTVGGHVNFELQYYACRAAMEIGEKRLAQYLELEFKNLITCVPQLMVLLYKDGSPLVSKKIREWLVNCDEENKSKHTPEHIHESSTFLANIQEEIKHLLESDQVSFERKLAKSILYLTATMMKE